MLPIDGGAQITTTTQVVLANHDVASRRSASVAPSGAASAEAGTATVSPTPTTPRDLPDFAFSLQIDQETNRLIMEWSDPESGLIVLQIPAKTAVQAFKESNAPTLRGDRINSQA